MGVGCGGFGFVGSGVGYFDGCGNGATVGYALRVGAKVSTVGPIVLGEDVGNGNGTTVGKCVSTTGEPVGTGANVGNGNGATVGKRVSTTGEPVGTPALLSTAASSPSKASSSSPSSRRAAVAAAVVAGGVRRRRDTSCAEGAMRSAVVAEAAVGAAASATATTNARARRAGARAREERLALVPPINGAARGVVAHAGATTARSDGAGLRDSMTIVSGEPKTCNPGRSWSPAHTHDETK